MPTSAAAPRLTPMPQSARSRYRGLRRWCAVAGAACLLGCAATEPSDGTCDATDCDGTSSTSDAQTSGGTEPSGGGTATASESSEGDDSSSTGGPPAAGCADNPSGGLLLRHVSVFQAIEVPVARDCAAIDVADRVAPLVAGRVAMVRGTVEPTAAWTARQVAAQIDLESSAGAETFTGACTMVGGSGPVDVHVEVPGAAIETDTEYTTSIVECDGSASLDAFPRGASAPLGAETTGVIRLHLVPFEVGGFVPDTSQAVLDGFRDAIMAVYPVTDVEFTIEDVQPDDNSGQVDMGGLMFRLIALQEEAVFGPGGLDSDAADLYYYGLVTGAPTREQFCGSCSTGTSESGVGDRAGSAVGAAFGDELSQSTLIHELGHMHGLLHSPCGDPDLQDDGFPYGDGSTQTEGWDFRSRAFVAPEHNDLMGYCQPRWVSDYHYNKMVEWVRLANSWGAMESPTPRAGERVSCSIGR